LLKSVVLAFGLILLLLAVTLVPGEVNARAGLTEKQGQIAQNNAPAQSRGKGQKTDAAQPAPQDQPTAQTAPLQPSQPPLAEQAPIGPALDKLGASLSQIEASLEKHELTDASLADLHEQIDALSASIANLLGRLTPRLADIKTRLDQLGSPPGDNAPAESPGVTAERSAQQKLFNDTDELIKRARLLAVQADQIGTDITARRRALFTRSLFAQVRSLANPTLWTDVWHEAPADIAAIRAVFADWIGAINERFDSYRPLFIWGGLGLLILLILPFSWLASRLASRNPAIEKPNRFSKILAAWRVTILISIPAAVAISIAGYVFHSFGLENTRLLPFAAAFGGAIMRIIATAAVAIGLFAPRRPNWRLLKIDDRAAASLVRAAIGVAFFVSVTGLFEALNNIVGASLPFAVTLRGLAAMLGALMLVAELWRFGSDAESEECFGPEITTERGWFDLVRLVSFVVAFVIITADLAGYVAFGSFVFEQFFRLGAVASLLFLLIALFEEAVSAGLSPKARAGHRLIASIGFDRNSLELMGVLLSGVFRLALFAIAASLLLAPWGLRRSDVPIDFNAAFFGFQIGDVTVSPFNVFVAIGLFALAFAILHAVIQWLDGKLFPHLKFDLGLRNSIRTSLGYLNFLLAAALSLGYLGLNFEKLALLAGALSVGIGFGLQSIVNNFVSGLILLWERAVRVGDWIIVGGDQGYVRRINVRSTEVETFDRAQVIIPNSNLVSGVVTNLVRNDRTGRIVIPLTVVPTAEPEKVREVLLAIAKANSIVLTIPAPQILFTGMSATSLNFELRVFVADVETSFRVKSDLNFEIFRRFKAEKFFDSPVAATKIEIVGFENPPAAIEAVEVSSRESVKSSAPA